MKQHNSIIFLEPHAGLVSGSNPAFMSPHLTGH